MSSPPTSEMYADSRIARSEMYGESVASHNQTHGGSNPPYTELQGSTTGNQAGSELSSEPRAVEMPNTPNMRTSMTNPITRKAVASSPPPVSPPVLSSAGAGGPISPLTNSNDDDIPVMSATGGIGNFGFDMGGGSSMEPAPTADELTSLREQHAQLESRRQRILELEEIEKEQRELEAKMKKGGK